MSTIYTPYEYVNQAIAEIEEAIERCSYLLDSDDFRAEASEVLTRLNRLRAIATAVTDVDWNSRLGAIRRP